MNELTALLRYAKQESERVGPPELIEIAILQGVLDYGNPLNVEYRKQIETAIIQRRARLQQ
jgi:hypothetical protein